MSTKHSLWEPWVWQDWRTPDVLRLTARARCVWFELLGIMWLDGKATWSGSLEQMARETCTTLDDCTAFLKEAERTRVCDLSVTRNSDVTADVTVTSRRRHRELKAKQSNRLRQQRYREKGDVTPPSRSASRSRDGVETETETYREENRGASGRQQAPPEREQQVSTRGVLLAGAKQHARGASNGKVNTEDVREVLRTLNATTGGSFRWKSPRGGETHGAKLIRAWLRHGYRVEDLERVIHSQHAAWSGRPEMAGNLRPDVLFGAKFEDYLDAPSGEAT